MTVRGRQTEEKTQDGIEKGECKERKDRGEESKKEEMVGYRGRDNTRGGRENKKKKKSQEEEEEPKRKRGKKGFVLTSTIATTEVGVRGGCTRKGPVTIPGVTGRVGAGVGAGVGSGV